MKLWQLVSVMRQNDNVEAIESVASSKPQWQEFAACLENWNALVDTQERAKLDYVLPEDVVLSVLERSELRCFLSHNRVMRSWQFSPVDASISLADAYRRYGGNALEEAFECGSIAMPTM